MASELVPVEQVDRDLARSFFSPGASREACLSGKFDDRPLLQALARHRLAAIEAQASRIAELEAGIKLAAVWFEEYALLHRAKGTAEGNDKGQRNQDRADQLRTLLGDREG